MKYSVCPLMVKTFPFVWAKLVAAWVEVSDGDRLALPDINKVGYSVLAADIHQQKIHSLPHSMLF